MLLQNRDHPTAAELFLRRKSVCHIFAHNDLRLPRGFTRFEPGETGEPGSGSDALLRNLSEHGRFYCESCRQIFDVEIPFGGAWNLPPGFVVSEAQVSLRGLCPKCHQEEKQ